MTKTYDLTRGRRKGLDVPGTTPAPVPRSEQIVPAHESPMPIPKIEPIVCCVCGKSAFVATHDTLENSKTWFQGCSLPTSWFITDSFPPGDDGLKFACSIDCTTKYQG